MKKAKSVEEYIELHPHFEEKLSQLRAIILSTELKECFKWNSPVYTLGSKNVLGIGAFKNHYGIWFFNGVFLKDEHNLLVNAQENTKALRQLRFEEDTVINKDLVLLYVREAIENQKLGKELKPERHKKPVAIPTELQFKLNSNELLCKAFAALTPGKQREYCEHIETAKREATKQSRLEKITPLILKGVGLHDKYKNC
ncbi:MAG: YdeI/OmpD-associated family protein [Bizionia sp.]|nr:YdeI/OmpD-associated family protein [Bizionia sp.]